MKLVYNDQSIDIPIKEINFNIETSGETIKHIINIDGYINQRFPFEEIISNNKVINVIFNDNEISFGVNKYKAIITRIEATLSFCNYRDINMILEIVEDINVLDETNKLSQVVDKFETQATLADL